MENVAKFNVDNQQYIIIVLEDASDFSTETNEVYFVPLKWAEEKQFNKFQGKDIPIELKKEIEQFKVQNIKSFYYSNDLCENE